MWRRWREGLADRRRCGNDVPSCPRLHLETAAYPRRLKLPADTRPRARVSIAAPSRPPEAHNSVGGGLVETYGDDRRFAADTGRDRPSHPSPTANRFSIAPPIRRVPAAAAPTRPKQVGSWDAPSSLDSVASVGGRGHTARGSIGRTDRMDGRTGGPVGQRACIESICHDSVLLRATLFAEVSVHATCHVDAFRGALRRPRLHVIRCASRRQMRSLRCLVGLSGSFSSQEQHPARLTLIGHAKSNLLPRRPVSAMYDAEPACSPFATSPTLSSVTERLLSARRAHQVKSVPEIIR